ncbi:Protein disulfide-isomerase A5 [Eumeta japonica]|uniref:Protein disulfide-isomerase A5 n=1 Tax=Eumeta variegata TaxID=151549 RepID=A0A4C1ZWB8_EUMVA|nr:Protein disulfide-isomerase A5 [Eumeta japonica]
MGAIDATQEPELAKRYEVKGYPTLKYFSYGGYKYDASHLRQEEQIVEFMKNPQEPPPPPPPETPWAEEESAVLHLDRETFQTTLRKKRHALVMFYAPWCGHCKNAKPEFVRAAERLSDELFLAFGAVDCTAEQALCADYGVKGYPTIKYFSFYNKLIKDYTGARQEEDFVSFMRIQMDIQKSWTESDNSLRKSNEEAGFGANVQLAYDNDFEHIVDLDNPTFVMFYASWCDHCSKVKPALSQLAARIKSSGSLVRVVAIDIADNPKVADVADIQNLPTFKLYMSGRIVTDYKGDGSYGDMLNFIKKNRLKDEL